MENRLNAMEYGYIFGVVAMDICLASDLVIPAKFKTHNFKKCKGNTYQRSHLVMYFRKMVAHTENEKLLIHCFQDSLNGASLKWYMGLEKSIIKCWKDLADSFLHKYKYNLDMALD